MNDVCLMHNNCVEKPSIAGTVCLAHPASCQQPHVVSQQPARMPAPQWSPSESAAATASAAAGRSGADGEDEDMCSVRGADRHPQQSAEPCAATAHARGDLGREAQGGCWTAGDWGMDLSRRLLQPARGETQYILTDLSGVGQLGSTRNWVLLSATAVHAVVSWHSVTGSLSPQPSCWACAHPMILDGQGSLHPGGACRAGVLGEAAAGVLRPVRAPCHLQRLRAQGHGQHWGVPHLPHADPSAVQHCVRGGSGAWYARAVSLLLCAMVLPVSWLPSSVSWQGSAARLGQ